VGTKLTTAYTTLKHSVKEERGNCVVLFIDFPFKNLIIVIFSVNLCEPTTVLTVVFYPSREFSWVSHSLILILQFFVPMVVNLNILQVPFITLMNVQSD